MHFVEFESTRVTKADPRRPSDTGGSNVPFVSKVGSLALLLALGFLARGAAALSYGDLDVIYAENFDDDTSMSDLVPQTDAFGAGRLHEFNLGNGPFTAVSLEISPGVPRGAARATVSNTHAAGEPYEATFLSYDPNVPSPYRAPADVGVQRDLPGLEHHLPGDHTFRTHVRDQYLRLSSQHRGELPRGGGVLRGAVDGPCVVDVAETTDPGATVVPPPNIVPLSPAVYGAILGGAPYQITLLLDRAAGTATAELVVGTTAVTAGPRVLSAVTPRDPLARYTSPLGPQR